MARYLSGLCVAGLGLCGGGWLVVAAVVFSGADGGVRGGTGRVNLATGAGLVAVCCVTVGAWAVAWRRRLRADGVLGEQFATVSRRQARRNRRELKRDVRRAARSAKQSAREARRLARRIPRLADSEFGGGLDRLGFGSGAFGGGAFGGGLSGTEPLGSGQSGGGLGEPRGWIGGGVGRPGYAPHGAVRDATVLIRPGPGPDPAGPEPDAAGPDATMPDVARPAAAGLAGPDAAEVLGQLRTLLGPLLTAAPPEPASPPLPKRQPGQERPGIPRKQAGRAPGHTGWPPVGPAAARAGGPAGGTVPAAAGGPAVSEHELQRLAECEEAWW